MAVLSDIRKTRTYSLPSIEGSEVVVYESLLVKDAYQLEDIQDKGFGGSVKLLQALIKSWNLTNEKGEALPVSEENISLLPLNDIKGILEDVAEVMGAKKKEQ